MSDRTARDQIEGHGFFDPSMPEAPSEILGIPTEPMLDVCDALGSIAMLSNNLPSDAKLAMLRASLRGESAMSLFPLIERVRAGEEISPEDVRPYRKPIKKLSPKVGSADGWARFAVVLGGTGIPLRRTLNRKLEEGFVERAPGLLDEGMSSARAYLPVLEPYVEFMEGFENPREQFVSEVAVVAWGIRNATRHNAERRGRHHFVTARDAAAGIGQTMGEILHNRARFRQQLPMFSHFIMDRLPPDTRLPSPDILTIAAPEIVDLIENGLPEGHRDHGLARDIRNHANPGREIASFFSGKLGTLQNVSDRLLPGIRNLLPTSGEEVRAAFGRLEDFLAADTNTAR